MRHTGGFNTRATSDKQTIVRRLVNGTKMRPPIPIVWGISATIAHFESAMQESTTAPKSTDHAVTLLRMI
jgi:hypothetical protein